MAKLTAWIKCSEQQPTIPGWYDVWWTGCSGVSHERRRWDGTEWLDLDGVHTSFGNYLKHFPSDAWRGLADKPEGQP